MKISKLFHWLYAILMLFPFVALVFNFVRFGLSSQVVLTSFNDVVDLVKFPNWGGLSASVRDIYDYLLSEIFVLGSANNIRYFVIDALTYWTIISIVYLIFDVLMYVPLLVHRWLDKGIVE